MIRKWKRKVVKASSLRAGAASMAMDELAKRKAVRDARASMKMTMRQFCESADFARPYLDHDKTGSIYTDVGWAIVDAADGNRPSLDDDRARRIFGCTTRELPCPGKPYRTAVLGLGRGAGKTSRLGAVKCVHAAWTTDLSTISPDDEAVCLLIGPLMRHAKQAFRFVLGVIRRSPILSASIARDERGRMVVSRESVTLQRPDGRRVRIEIGAASKGGANGRSGTIVFALLEEACFFRSEDSAAVNDRAIYDAITGAARGVHQVVWIVSTPWVEGEGLMEEIITREAGKHRHSLSVARVPSKWLNPYTDPTGEVEAAKRAMPGGDVDVDREFYAIPMPKGSRSFFDPVKLAECLALECPDWQPSDRTAGADLGFNKDAAVVQILFKYTDETFGVPCMRELVPQKDAALVPSHVGKEFATIVRGYGISRVWADHVYKEAFREHLSAYQVTLAHNHGGDEAKLARFSLLRELVFKVRLRLGSLPAKERESLRSQMLSITVVPVGGGKQKIIIPRTPINDLADGNGTTFRHADAVAALVEAVAGIGASAVTEQEKQEARPGHAEQKWAAAEVRPAQPPRNPGKWAAATYQRR